MKIELVNLTLIKKIMKLNKWKLNKNYYSYDKKSKPNKHFLTLTF